MVVSLATERIAYQLSLVCFRYSPFCAHRPRLNSGEWLILGETGVDDTEGKEEMQGGQGGTGDRMGG